MELERGIIDRFEGDIVVIEVNGITRDLPRAVLPRDAKVGDVVIFDSGELRVDQEETNKRKQDVANLMDKLFE